MWIKELEGRESDFLGKTKSSVLVIKFEMNIRYFREDYELSIRYI